MVMSRKTLVLVVLALVPFGIGVVTWLLPSDRKAIRRIAEDCRDAFVAGDAGRILAHLDEGATAGGYVGSGELAPKVGAWVDRYSGSVKGIALAQRKIEVDGDTAEGEWMATLRLRRSEQGLPVHKGVVRVRLRRIAGGWRVSHVEAGRP